MRSSEPDGHCAVSGSELCTFLPWDSDFFGRRIARIVPTRLDRRSVAAVQEWTEANSIDCLYFLADPLDAESVRLAETAGFHLTDVRVVLERHLQSDPVTAVSPSLPAAGHSRQARTGDQPALMQIAGVSHVTSRFYYDADFSRDDCRRFYETWIARSLEGFADTVLVVEAEGAVAGYVCCHLPRRHHAVDPLAASARIGLIGVSERAHRRGIGRQLLNDALRWFFENGVRRVTVATQARNVPAQCLYQSAGFRTLAVGLWYHKWIRESPAGGL